MDIVERLIIYPDSDENLGELIQAAIAEVERLRKDKIAWQNVACDYANEIERLQTGWELATKAVDKNESLREAHERIVEWSRAYPLAVFPKPDLKKAHELLQAGGMTLDAISAEAMRHVIEQVAKISSAALERNP